MRLPLRGRQLLLTAHVVASVGWLGAATAYLALVATALIRSDADTTHATYVVLAPMTWFAIVPLAFASLLTGVVQALVTHWGLVRHYWVAFKLLLSVLATIVLLVNTATIDSLESLAAAGGHMTEVGGLEGQLLHAGGGVLVLLATTTLAMFKPAGLTPFGRGRR